MMKLKFLLAFALLTMLSFTSFAQQVAPQEGQKMISPGRAFFVPHWWIKAQGGAAVDVGEAKFSDLISPALQLSTGYQFSELLAVRGSLSGLWARNQYAYPNVKYKWNFVQPTVGAEIDLTNLILGSDPERSTHAHAYLGAGVAYTWGNDDAKAASTIYGVGMEKLWDGSRWNAVIKAGIGVDYNVTDNIAIGAEINANMLPDHFNSKKGRNDNRDWRFNALVGVKFIIGKSHGRTEPVYETPPLPVKTIRDTVFVDVPIDKISFNVNIYFIINRSDIRSNQMLSLQRLIAYLDKHPKAFVRLSGYADRDTGTPEINMRLSRERANSVSQFLKDAGIQEWRIRRFAKGDRVQPFEKPSDNRVCICYVYDPEHPERIDNWY